MSTVERSIPREELTRLLSSALGEEKSEEVVLHAAQALGLSGAFYSADEVRAIFARLSAAAGLIGVVARFAVSRGDVEEVVSRSIRPSAPSVDVTPKPTSVDALLPLLAPALGVDKARDAVGGVVTRLGLDPRRLTHAEAIQVLDDLAATEGIVGVVARFAKARFLLTS